MKILKTLKVGKYKLVGIRYLTGENKGNYVEFSQNIFLATFEHKEKEEENSEDSELSRNPDFIKAMRKF